jgi:hypothetical protein
LFDTSGIRPDGLVLQASGASRREAMVRVTTLTGMEQAMLALYGCVASIAWLCLGRAGLPMDVTLPWAVIPVPAFAAAFWLASRYRARLAGRAGWPARLSVFLDAVLLIRALFARPVRHRGAIGGMALFWAGDAAAVWSALAAFGFVMNGAALIVGYCTGMVFTRRNAPLAGAGTLALILPLTIWASGAPLATAITGAPPHAGRAVRHAPSALRAHRQHQFRHHRDGDPGRWGLRRIEVGCEHDLRRRPRRTGGRRGERDAATELGTEAEGSGLAVDPGSHVDGEARVV